MGRGATKTWPFGQTDRRAKEKHRTINRSISVSIPIGRVYVGDNDEMWLYHPWGPLPSQSKTRQPETRQDRPPTFFSQRAYLDVLFRVLEVIKQCVFSPNDSTLLVGRRIRVAFGLSALATEESVQVGTLLVGASLLDGVALGALGLEDLGSLLLVRSLLLGHDS